MSDKTTIEWTEATWNPIRARRKDGQPNKGGGGWACQRVSPGCQNCYAARINRRLGTGFDYAAKGIAASDIYLDEKALTQPLHWRRPRKVFVCSMTDLFGEWVPDEMIDRVFAVMALSPQHTFQVLTKRPERMRAYMSDDRREEWVSDRIWADPWPIRMLPEVSVAAGRDRVYGGWPLPNVWLGTSVEDQEQADKRIPELLATPAAVRFVSYEPALGLVNFDHIDCTSDSDPGFSALTWTEDDEGTLGDAVLDWIIVGGESGPGARPFDIGCSRSVVRQCQAAGVAVFVKQLGARPVDANDGSPVMSLPVSIGDYPGKRLYHLRDRKGGDMSEWPEDLRVREFPEVRQ